MAIIQGYSRIDGVKEEKKEFRRMSVAAGIAVKPLGKGESEETEERPSYKRVVAHLGHATWDIM